jgi:hypothetical protein
MPRLQLMPHLTYDELGERFRRCGDGRQKVRWQALWLLRRPHAPYSAAQAAAVVGLTADAIRKLIKRYNAGGPGAVERNAGGQGRAPRLSAAQQRLAAEGTFGAAPMGNLLDGVFLLNRGWGYRLRLRNFSMEYEYPVTGPSVSGFSRRSGCGRSPGSRSPAVRGTPR